MPKSNLNVILDLDNTLINTFDDYDSLIDLEIFKKPCYLDIRERVYFFNLDEQYWGVSRPYAKEFVSFCFQYFNTVGVWSAGERDYVDFIIENIFEDKKPHYSLSRDECAGEYNDKNIKCNIFKPLNIIFDTNNYFTPKNTLIIDDNEYTMKMNRDNGILIPPYEPEPTIEDIRKPDYAFPSICRWLSKPEVMYCDDIRKQCKLSIFTSLL
jgi:TFIIF-interacting CTD phosphatase-like protein